MKKKIAIVHDALVVPAGSERVALNISNLFPEAPIYTSAYLPENTFPEFKTKDVRTLPYLGRIKSEKQFKSLYPLWLMEISSLNLSEYDLVITSANYLSKFINVPTHTQHICYLHNPIRFLWKTQSYSKDSVPFGRFSLPFIRMFLPILQQYDLKKTRKIDHLIVNSKNIASQVRRIYGKESTVIYPPVDINTFPVSTSHDDYYLYSGRLISHKRVEIAIQACKKLGRRLIIAGDGLERKNLEAIAGENITFLGRTSDEDLKTLYANCRALIFPSDEDFGLVPVEAQACGRPVIAYRAGGALETIEEGVTGVFFNEQTVESLINGIIQFETEDFTPSLIREKSMRFDISVFQEKFIEYVSTIG